MNMELLITFILLNILNVIIHTGKTIATIKCGKLIAAVTNALAYGLNTIVVIYLMCDLPLFWKAIIVAVCNFIGVFIVKWFEEKSRKDKLWKVEVTVPHHDACKLLECLYKDDNFSYNYVDVRKYVLFNFYCPTQQDTLKVKELLKDYHAKYFVSESKSWE